MTFGRNYEKNYSIVYLFNKIEHAIKTRHPSCIFNEKGQPIALSSIAWVRRKPDHKGHLLYVTLPCIYVRDCFNGSNSWPHDIFNKKNKKKLGASATIFSFYLIKWSIFYIVNNDFFINSRWIKFSSSCLLILIVITCPLISRRTTW